ncbi:carboxypeptidase regulatory-like domain-containing protein [Ornithinibacillus halophilus]|uniref:Serine protease, subtilisin family n=1 Tax=Ornithinibacillus halophilus TaxID=930117 RepID=A0A1M5EB02_9BACI|nr:carboxypeptidase regulatory-like domain-containing protein [Ornithinibacillus halophilus]SHF76377.1 Serine protease, subtilisin family [Ornithinibacillus halophilus]
MDLYRIKKYRRSLAIFMIAILMSTVLLPQNAFAQITPTQENGNKTIEKELELEKELEESIHKQEENSDKTSVGIPSLADRLNFEDTETKDESQFAMDGKVDKKIIQKLEEEETVNIIIRLQDSVDMNSLMEDVSNVDGKTDRGQKVINQLQKVAESKQGELKQFLSELETDNQVSNVKQFWVFNGMAATVTKDALGKIAKRDDVKLITLDVDIQLPETEMEENPPRLPEWGLEKINAPKVWGEYGIQGEGIVVGIMDSGVQGDHEALRHNYRGKDEGHEHSWIDLSGHGYSEPTDGNSHGTHVAGTAVGGGEGEPIGVAPGAEWIAAKIFDDGGGTTASAIHEAFQWFLAPGGDASKAPHVVNNSWGSADTYRTEFLEGVQAWVAAGILPLFSAGNEGPGAGTIGSPASFPESFAIGATDRFDQIASFSSRGPVYWPDENGDSVYYLKPNVSAPGQQVYSAVPNGGYGTKSGTSMASPHVAGAIALLLQSQPDLTIDEIRELLEDTVRTEEHMGTLPNDQYGEGIVDIYQAVTEASFAGEVEGTLTDLNGDPISGQLYFPDEELTIEIEEDGVFSFKIREGEHEVKVQAFGYDSIDDNITITKGEMHEFNWQLESSDRFDITGTVTVGDGEVAPFAYVRVEDTPLKTVRTNENGEFTITGIPEDEYTLVISGQGLKRTSETVNVSSDIHITIETEALEMDGKADWTTSKNNFSRNAVTDAGIDAESLQLNWSFDTPGEVLFSSPVIAEGKVVFTTDRGYVVVLDQNTGEELWSVGTGNLNRSTPTVVDGVIYVGGGGDYSVHAIDLETGVKKWTRELDYPAVYESPIYKDGVIYISSYMETDAKTVALDSENGNIIWEKVIGDGAFFGAALGEDNLFVGTYDSKTLSSLTLEDGEEVWTVTLDNEGFAANPVYVDGVVYVVSTNFDTGTGTLRAYDATSGEEIWKVSDVGNTEAGSPIIVDNLVVIGSAQLPVIKAFDKNTGDLIWEADNGSVMVNSGSVSGDGHLYVTDIYSSTLKVYDVYSGERLYTYALNGSSSSGVALTDGEVVVADETSVFSFTAPGIISGTVTDEEGNNLQGTITLVGTDEAVQISEDGSYVLQARPGTYQVKVSSYGYIQETEEVQFVSGYELERDFQLQVAEEGSMSGTVVNKETNEPLEGVTVTVLNTPLEGTTDENGEFGFSDVYEGTYDVKFHIPGFVEQIVPVTVTGGEESLFIQEMPPVEVAVLHDMDGQIVRFLNSNNISAEEHDWSIIDDIGSYNVVYLNGAYTSSGPKPTEEQILGIIEAAKEEKVSLVFADSWGPSYGSLRYLADFTGDPNQYDSYNGLNADIYLRVDEEHPITAGVEKGITQTTLTNGYAAWFNQYSGRHLATLGTSRDGFQGSGVAYKGVSEDSAHLLLSSHAASPWVSPYDGWTGTQQQIFLNGINYLLDEVEFGKVSGTITDSEGNALEDITIQVVDTGVSVTTDENGAYELYHDEGSFEVAFIGSGLSTQYATVDFEKGQPVTEDIVMVSTESGTISGSIVNKMTGQEIRLASVKLFDRNDELLEETSSNVNGSFEITGLNEDTYTIEISNNGFVTFIETVQVGTEPVSLNVELYPAPAVATLGDYSFGSIGDVLSEVGIRTRDFDLRDVIEELPNLDVVFFNEQSSYSTSKELFEEFLAVADEHEVSIIYGDTYWSGSGINHLVENFQDPESRSTHRDTSNPAGYLIHEENPIFGDAEAGEFVEIMIPSASSVGSFEGYSGITIADVTHGGNESTHGAGVAFKPRTAGSMELLMSGHGTSFTHDTRDYTDKGNEMFINAILWAAYIEYNSVEGIVTDQDGNPLDAQLNLRGEVDQETSTNPETGNFSIGSLDGEYELEVNSFGYQTYTQTITIDENMEELSIEMVVDESVGSIEGTFIDENTLEGIEGAQVDVIGQPRSEVTDVSGEFVVENLLPGTYTLLVNADGYVVQEFDIEVQENEATTFERTMKPSPKVGVVVDTDPSRYLSVKDYLTSRNYIVEDIFFTDLDKIEEMDLVFVNSDYDNSLIPEEDEFIAFTKELDRTETPVIWTGSNGPRGGIRFLIDYFGDPEVENRGTNSTSNREMTATKVQDHPILDGVTFDENNQLLFDSYYYYGFEGYTGTTIATIANESQGELGSFVAYGGRTMNSVEVLLSTMTFGHGFSDDQYFDKDRERIINNAITFALENDEPLVGEVRGTVKNNFEREVFSTVTVEETGYTLDTEQDGSFFIGLDDGTYTLTIEAFGHTTESFEVEVERGQVVEESFVLQSEDAGILKGSVTAVDTGEGVEGATVQLVGTPIQTQTDEDGNYEFQAPTGTYQVRVTANGYTPVVVNETVNNGEETVVDFALTISEKIAFMTTSYNQSRAIPFLEEQGYEVDFWLNSDIDQLMEEMEEYALIIFNDRHTSSTPEAKFKEFVELADEYNVSMIFPGQFNNGTIRYLSDFYGDPESDISDFEPDFINYTVLENHPIFEGFEVGEEIRILAREGSNQQYYAFENYSGTTIADISHDELGRLGAGLAYDFRTSSSVHVLLGSLHIGSYGHPEDRWNEDTKRIYINAIDWALSASLGEVSGTVVDEDNNPISGATISIPEENLSTQTNSNGEYRLGVGIGEHEVTVQAKGYVPQSESIEIEELGHVVELDFELQRTDRASLSGTVTDVDGEGLEEVTVTLNEIGGDFEEVKVTNAEGYYQFDELLDGDYELTVEANGYQTITDTVTLEVGQSVERDYTLSEFNIAVLGDIKDNLVSFLADHDYAAQNRDWNIVDDVYNYSLIIVNSKDASEEQLNQLINEADEYETSLIFVDTWGVDGSIPLLEEVFGQPNRTEQGYNEGAVYIETQSEHEIFNGLTEESIKIHSETSPYAAFENYEGITLASLVVDGENKGDTIAYDFRGENHMHLLLSSFAVNNMIGPNQGWTEQGKQLFLNAVGWARDAKQDLPQVPEWENEEDILTSGDIVLSGTGEYRSTVTISHGDEVLAEIVPNHDGTFTAEITNLDHGEYDLVLASSNFAGTVTQENTVHVIVDKHAPELELTSPSDHLITNKEVVDVTGTVADDNLHEVFVNDELVSVLEDGSFDTRVILEEGTNIVTITAMDLVGNVTTIERTVTLSLGGPEITEVSPQEDMYLVPGEEVEIRLVSDAENGDATYSIKLPGQNTPQSSSDNVMEEIEPGVYAATWVVPTNLEINGAIIEVSLTDIAGNTTKVETPGKLFVSSEQIERLSGELRYETAVEISREGFDTAETVVLARGTEFADALAGVPLAFKLDAPILLTRSDELYSATLDEIHRLGASKVVILGGTGAINEDVEAELEAEGLNIRRIAGENRYATAALIAEEVAPDGIEQAIVANGRDFPDALSAATHAAKAGMPILLTRPDSLPEETASVVETLGVTETIIVGGYEVVTEEVAAQLPAVERLRGTNRYETNIVVNDYFGVDNNHLYVATGKQYADALTGAVLAAKNDSTIVLVSTNIPEDVAAFIENNDTYRLTVFGGEGAISSEVVDGLEMLLP